MHPEIWRNLTHLVIGTAIAFYVLLVPKWVSLLILSVALLIGMWISKKISEGVTVPIFSFLIDKMEREGVAPGKGTITFFFGSIIALALLPIFYAFLGILCLAVGDAMATIVGILRDKKRKSWEGTLACFLFNTLALAFFIPYLTAVIVGAISAIVERFAPFDDNLFIPLITGGVGWLLGV